MLIVEFSGKYMGVYYEILSTFLCVWKFYNEMLGEKPLNFTVFLGCCPILSVQKNSEPSSVLLIQFSVPSSTEITLT